MSYDFKYAELSPYYQKIVDALARNHGYSDAEALKILNDYYDVLEIISGYYPAEEEAELLHDAIKNDCTPSQWLSNLNEISVSVDQSTALQSVDMILEHDDRITILESKLNSLYDRIDTMIMPNYDAKYLINVNKRMSLSTSFASPFIDEKGNFYAPLVRTPVPIMVTTKNDRTLVLADDKE
ncbi:hypothetical protein [Brevibacillus reuszeri]|uniref:hypothetical protein n=1 Tax=Brevibacillus reuszeri TaxID=54915 RepID=UPI000CCBFA72|nr:hypothetical protein [Brevibacillus reuszeri]